MCGRFVVKSPAEVIAEHFDLTSVPTLTPRYNIAPSLPIAAIRNNRDNQREFVPLLWGLIPSWAKDPKVGNRMINARSETVTEKPAFRHAIRRRRCVIPADGYYEWSNRGGIKQPYYIYPQTCVLFAFAGIWEHWQAATGEEIESCSILTSSANSALETIHHRMPVIVPRAEISTWLDNSTEDTHKALAMLAPAPNDLVGCHPVSRMVNSPRNDDSRCIERYTTELDLFDGTE